MMSKDLHSRNKPGLLFTANWDSDVGYAWWLMESYWVTLSRNYQHAFHPILAYPSISRIPELISEAPITVCQSDFSSFGRKIVTQLSFILRNRIKIIYFSDKPVRHWAYLLFRLVGVKKIVIHDHAPGLRTPATGLKRMLKKCLMAVPGIKADVCIGATDFVRQRFVDVACVPESKCFSVPNGIPTDLPDRESIHNRFDIPRDRQVIVTAARANRYKGGFFALDVLAELGRSGYWNWHYVYMGDGPDREALQARSRQLGLSEHVNFPGKIDNVLGLLQTATFAFQPSKGEVGYSLSILEYMLCGLPVVVPDNPSVSGATEEGVSGSVYREANVEDAAGVISGFLDSPAKTLQMGEAAAQVVRDHFSIENTHKELVRVFGSAVVD